jgi:hypothetical protein
MGIESTSEASLRRPSIFVILSERRMNNIRVGSGLDGSIPIAPLRRPKEAARTALATAEKGHTIIGLYLPYVSDIRRRGEIERELKGLRANWTTLGGNQFSIKQCELWLVS